jgi:rhodanese-related sulfurtransferase
MVKHGFKQMLAEANARIPSISVPDALKLVDDPATIFVDVRETIEVQKSGMIEDAIHAPRGFLEFIADPESPMHNPELASGKRLVIYCASGGRSTLATRTLLDMGLTNVVNLTGGFAAWRQAGGPTGETG